MFANTKAHLAESATVSLALPEHAPLLSLTAVLDTLETHLASALPPPLVTGVLPMTTLTLISVWISDWFQIDLMFFCRS